MELKDQVFNAFRQRVKSGKNIEAATLFMDSDFPGVTSKEIKEFCDMGYGEKYLRNFKLSDAAVEEALEEP